MSPQGYIQSNQTGFSTSRLSTVLRIVDSWNEPTVDRAVGSHRPALAGMTLRLKLRYILGNYLLDSWLTYRDIYRNSK